MVGEEQARRAKATTLLVTLQPLSVQAQLMQRRTLNRRHSWPRNSLIMDVCVQLLPQRKHTTYIIIQSAALFSKNWLYLLIKKDKVSLGLGANSSRMTLKDLVHKDALCSEFASS